MRLSNHNQQGRKKRYFPKKTQRKEIQRTSSFNENMSGFMFCAIASDNRTKGKECCSVSPLKKGSGFAGKDTLWLEREQGKLLENTVNPLWWWQTSQTSFFAGTSRTACVRILWKSSNSRYNPTAYSKVMGNSPPLVKKPGRHSNKACLCSRVAYRKL